MNKDSLSAKITLKFTQLVVAPFIIHSNDGFDCMKVKKRFIIVTVMSQLVIYFFFNYVAQVISITYNPVGDTFDGIVVIKETMLGLFL